MYELLTLFLFEIKNGNYFIIDISSINDICIVIKSELIGVIIKSEIENWCFQLEKYFSIESCVVDHETKKKRYEHFIRPIGNRIPFCGFILHTLEGAQLSSRKPAINLLLEIGFFCAFFFSPFHSIFCLFKRDVKCDSTKYTMYTTAMVFVAANPNKGFCCFFLNFFFRWLISYWIFMNLYTLSIEHQTSIKSVTIL